MGGGKNLTVILFNQILRIEKILLNGMKHNSSLDTKKTLRAIKTPTYYLIYEQYSQEYNRKEWNKHWMKTIKKNQHL